VIVGSQIGVGANIVKERKGIGRTVAVVGLSRVLEATPLPLEDVAQARRIP
jgi:hypothetical protein